MSGRSFWVHVVLALGALSTLGGCGSSSPPDEGYIEIVSEGFLVFREAGETARIQAKVHDRNGRVLDGVALSFESSAPEVATVDDSGLVTAMTGDLGSATITVKAGTLPPTVVVVAIAEMAAGAVVVPRDALEGIAYPDPENRERAWVTLRKTGATEAVGVGSVLFGGWTGGLLDRVVDVVDEGSSRGTYETVPASLTEVFEELSVVAEGGPVIFEGVLDDDGVRVTRTSRDWSREAPEETPAAADGEIRSPLSLSGLTCKTEGSTVQVGISGFSLEQRFELWPVVEIRITRGWVSSTVEKFEFYLRGQAAIVGTLGEVSLTGGLTGKLECSQEVATIPFAFVPLLGPVGIAPSVKPEFGFELKVSYAAGELKLNGPKVDKGVEVKIGFGYDAGQGFYPIRDRQDTGEGVTLGGASGAMKNEFKVSLEPFFRAILAKSITLAHWELLAAKTVSLKIFGGLDLALALPFDPTDRSYKGPEWNVYAGVVADLSPLMETLDPVNRLLRRLGLPSMGSIDVVLFQYKRVLKNSPKPRLRASPRKVTVDEVVQLRADAIGAGGLRTVFVAFPEPTEANPTPPMRTLIETTMPQDGIAQQEWKPKEGDDGRYALNVRVYDDFFGVVGLPYGMGDPDKMPEVEVIVDTSLTIDPTRIEGGQVGQTYPFTLQATRIPSEVATVRFVWDFGDGTTGEEDQAVAGGKAGTSIDHAWTAPGSYIVTAQVIRPDTGEQMADARASVTVGTQLTIVPSFLSGDPESEYPFQIDVVGIPAGQSAVTLSWNFGDGSETASGQQVLPVQAGQAGTTIYHRFAAEGSFGVYAVAQADGQNLADGTAMVVIGEVPEREYDLTICNTWQAAGSGGSSGTVDTWDISMIPKGAVFDLQFDAYSIPDMFLAEYPDGLLVLSTGWRGDSSYEGNPRYPGGIAGPGGGSVSGLFVKGRTDFFTVRVIGGEPGTAWDYQVSCRTGP
ncbi:MAG TPA: PKD domain-containing protein [Myxococcota bacterium]|nr:PKD domain-containing protein [Myxococcota bacterium]HQK50179.1 PKD domain-containing protein [Myxococcota bacterium]